MTNEELLSAIRGVVREEVNAGEQRMRTLVREEVNAGEQRMRTLVREEVNAAVYASEQRTGERLDKMDERQNRLEHMVTLLVEHAKFLRAAHRELKSDFLDIKNDQGKIVLVLNDVTMTINDLQRSQISLETRVEENLKGCWKELERMFANLQSFTKEFNKIVLQTHARLDEHEDTPLDETHPRRNPFSAI